MRGETRKGGFEGVAEIPESGGWGSVEGSIERKGILTPWLDGLLAGLLETTFVDRLMERLQQTSL
jgi:hypothetical protein